MEYEPSQIKVIMGKILQKMNKSILAVLGYIQFDQTAIHSNNVFTHGFFFGRKEYR